MKQKEQLDLIAWKARRKCLEMIRHANSGHIGGSFSAAEFLSVLYFDEMKIDPRDPQKPDRDRLILSKGHACPIYYALLSERGFFPEEDLMGYRRIEGYLSGHPVSGVPGVDMTSGSLGQGLSIGVGLALAAKTYANDYITYVVLGDGEMQEGQIWEAIMSANKFALDNLIAIVDRNGIQLDGATNEIMPLDPLEDKVRAFGWNVLTACGHDVIAVSDTLKRAKCFNGKPTMIIFDTVKGKGVSVFENEIRFHGGRPTAKEYEIAFEELDAKIAELEGKING